ncbi:alpha-soluble NSF attachment protein isoform X2 [Phacochoerus africanus]|uniref:alpha-soluble NSF attachment protein isoform X2 n=1 Tax=Phacochoerus africanus TaxID=41426 RepID=UPI001FD8D994|nr:alpha-soluble NSF attachment protein isoform X2 [Phacochoerus africanus]
MDNSGKEAEAMALLAEAERKVKNSQSFFSGLFGGSSKIEEACEIYARAANMFKMAKNWSAAGNAFCQAAQLHLQLQSKHDAATCFVDAGNAFKKADPQEAINCLIRAIEIYTDMQPWEAGAAIPPFDSQETGSQARDVIRGRVSTSKSRRDPAPVLAPFPLPPAGRWPCPRPCAEWQARCLDPHWVEAGGRCSAPLGAGGLRGESPGRLPGKLGPAGAACEEDCLATWEMEAVPWVSPAHY